MQIADLRQESKIHYTQQKMAKKYLSIALALALAGLVQSCKTQKKVVYQKTANGLEYRIIKDEPGFPKAAVGDYMEFHLKSYVKFPKGDSVIFDSRKMNEHKPVPYQLAASAYKGDLAEGFLMLTAGDSAVFRVSIDSMIKAGAQMLPWMEKGKGQKMEFTVKVTSLRTPAQKQKDDQEVAGRQNDIDESLIQDYLRQNNIQATRTASGLFYKIDKIGQGATPKKGNTVSMNYTGMTLDGTKFDSNVDPEFRHVQPFEFKLGMGQVIKGWDEGIALLPKGTKGTLYIPSTMAYGPNSPTPLIPANSVLVFDVEVVDIHE
jgi:FKBP-type peptidyl-prolyl cis-trans isomerase